MKRLMRIGLCAGALLVLGALGTTSASATAPEFGRCLKAEKVGKEYTGGYTNSSCTTVSGSKTGKYEWFPGAAKVKQTTKGGKGVLETVTKLTVECQSESSVGEYSGTKEVKNIVVTFKGCEVAGTKCSTANSEEGELVTKTLEGVVGFENKAAKKTAFDLYPQGKTGFFIEFACSGLSFAVRGSVLVPIKSDKMLLSGPLKYKAVKGKQQVEHFEGMPNDILESTYHGLPYAQSGQTITTTLTNEEKLELNAVV
ncbi:MAG TPA: hypothetical protein VMB51_09555 [Solirubrobacteraceae bacterium]|nr:hypothetical protein [Solirubrobacteraceae bacterium]